MMTRSVYGRPNYPSRRTEGVREVSTDDFNADSLISALQLVRLIVQRIPSNLDAQTTRNRVRSRINDHVRDGHLNRVDKNSFVFGEAMLWAELQWPGYFKDLPMNARPGRGEAVLAGLTAEGYGIQLPVNLNECHELLISLNRRIRELEKENIRLEVQVHTLRPAAERHYKRQRDGSMYGRRGGRGNIR